jgi:low affinity Fe/Cu permease
MHDRRVRNQFNRAADVLTRALGSPLAVAAAAAVIVVWAASGPIFHFSDTWQLVINTGTTIVTFLMVFIIQNSQNRDSKALHLKLDELIRAVADARNEYVTVERSSEEELQAREDEMAVVAEQVTEDAGHPEAKAAAREAGRTIARRTAPRSNGRKAHRTGDQGRGNGNDAGTSRAGASKGSNGSSRSNGRSRSRH